MASQPPSDKPIYVGMCEGSITGRDGHNPNRINYMRRSTVGAFSHVHHHRADRLAYSTVSEKRERALPAALNVSFSVHYYNSRTHAGAPSPAICLLGPITEISKFALAVCELFHTLRGGPLDAGDWAFATFWTSASHFRSTTINVRRRRRLEGLKRAANGLCSSAAPVFRGTKHARGAICFGKPVRQPGSVTRMICIFPPPCEPDYICRSRSQLSLGCVPVAHGRGRMKRYFR